MKNQKIVIVIMEWKCWFNSKYVKIFRADSIITCDKKQIESADKLILPGVDILKWQ